MWRSHHCSSILSSFLLLPPFGFVFMWDFFFIYLFFFPPEITFIIAANVLQKKLGVKTFGAIASLPHLSYKNLFLH